MGNLSPSRLKELYLARPVDLADAFTKSLKDFGYNDLDVDTVKAALDKYYSGDTKPVGVIEAFVFGWLSEGVDND